MRKTTKFLLGLLVGSSMAYLALKEMSPLKRRQLMNKIDRKMHSLKKDTVDYAFYANDTLGNTSRGVKRHAKSMADSIGHHAKYFGGQLNSHFIKDNHSEKHSHFQNATTHLRSALDQSSHNDIVLNPKEAFHKPSTIVVYYPDGTMKNC